MTGPPHVGLSTIAGEWLRIGTIGFGGPPAHIALFQQLCVRRRGWISETDFGHALAAVNLLPGPASTQLAIYCAWRLRGAVGGLVGGFCFIAPGLVAILALSALLLGSSPNQYVLGAAAGAGAAVAAVAVHAAAEPRPRLLGSGRCTAIRPASVGVISGGGCGGHGAGRTLGRARDPDCGSR